MIKKINHAQLKKKLKKIKLRELDNSKLPWQVKVIETKENVLRSLFILRWTNLILFNCKLLKMSIYLT